MVVPVAVAGVPGWSRVDVVRVAISIAGSDVPDDGCCCGVVTGGVDEGGGLHDGGGAEEGGGVDVGGGVVVGGVAVGGDGGEGADDGGFCLSD